MANKVIQLKDGSSNLYPTLYVVQISGTTGTSMYHGYYYADLSFPTGVTSENVRAVLPVGVASNVPAFAQVINSSTVRVYCPIASTIVNIRLIVA